MAGKHDRVVTVEDVAFAWFDPSDIGNKERLYYLIGQYGVEPDAVDVFGRPGWSADAVMEMVRRRDARARADGAATDQHRRDSDAWVARRTGAVRGAMDRAEGELGSVSPPGGLADEARVRAAGRHAGEQFERANPRPRLNDNTLVPLSYVDEREEGSLVARSLGALRGPRVTVVDFEDEREGSVAP